MADRGALNAEDVADELRALLKDDKAFRDRVSRLAGQKAATKALLIQVYKRLYRRTSGIRASAPRDEIIQIIMDERNILSRHGTLDALMRAEAVAAE